MSRTVSILFLSVAAVTLGGCSLMTTGVAEPQPATGDPAYQAGYRDGCTTAHGEYTKESDRFRNDKNYYDGWFAGRSACQNR